MQINRVEKVEPIPRTKDSTQKPRNYMSGQSQRESFQAYLKGLAKKKEEETAPPPQPSRMDTIEISDEARRLYLKSKDDEGRDF